VSCPLDGAKLVLTRLIKGRVGVMTKKTKAMAAEASTQCFLAVENMLFGRVLKKLNRRKKMRLPCAYLECTGNSP
jgi:hypothetical protein